MSQQYEYSDVNESRFSKGRNRVHDNRSGNRYVVQPEDIAALMHFLAASDCPPLSGQQIAVGGGLTNWCSSSNLGVILQANSFE